jgi:hypothetical protein
MLSFTSINIGPHCNLYSALTVNMFPRVCLLLYIGEDFFHINFYVDFIFLTHINATVNCTRDVATNRINVASLMVGIYAFRCQTNIGLLGVLCFRAIHRGRFDFTWRLWYTVHALKEVNRYTSMHQARVLKNKTSQSQQMTHTR